MKSSIWDVFVYARKIDRTQKSVLDELQPSKMEGEHIELVKEIEKVLLENSQPSEKVSEILRLSKVKP